MLCIVVRTNKCMVISEESVHKESHMGSKWGYNERGSGSAPPLHCWRILSKEGMECTPVFHNLFPHSSPLHVYKQTSEGDKKKGGKSVGDSRGDVDGSSGKMSGSDSSVEQTGEKNIRR